jgi:thiol-disulfide isomerase/thioredoxin
MARARPSRRWAGLVLVAALALSACTGDPAPPGITVTILPEAERVVAPALEGELLDGNPFDAGAVAGDVVVVNFWGSWCSPCIAEAADLEATYAATRDGGVSFVGVNVRDTRDAAKEFVASRSTYPSIFDPASRLVLGFDVPPTAIPSTVVIDRQGRIAMIVNRAVIRSELEPVVTQIAAEPS